MSPALSDANGVPQSELDAALIDRGPLGAAALALFDDLNCFRGSAFMRHNLRLFRLTRLLLEHARIEFDPQVAFAIAVVHDLGLVVRDPKCTRRRPLLEALPLARLGEGHGAAPATPSRATPYSATGGQRQALADDLQRALSRTQCYVDRSWLLFDQLLPPVSRENSTVARESLTLNHRMAPLRGTSPVAECFRQAVWVEHTRGARRHGLDKGEIRQVFQDHPRGHFDRVLLSFWGTTLRHEPASILRGILFQGPQALRSPALDHPRST